jgi:hypothetical protein
MKRKKRNFRKKIPAISVSILTFVLLVLFFFQKNTLVQERTRFQDYTQKLVQLTKQSENLEMGFVDKNHLKNIETIAQELNFEKVEKIHYIRILEGTVVAK